MKKVEKKPIEKKPVEKFGTQTEQAKVIFVFRNGDKHHKGVKMTIHPTKYKNMSQVKQAMTKEVGVSTGAVMKIYTDNGKLVNEMSEFENEGKYTYVLVLKSSTKN